MADLYPKPVAELIEQFSSLPGIGPKSAQRIAFYLIQLPQSEATQKIEAIFSALSQIQYCSRCFNFSVDSLCGICKSGQREEGVLCVVEDPRDVIRIERTGEFRGLYHILGGAINSMDGIGPDQIHIQELLDRVDKEEIKEVIVATNPNSEGEYTALYIAEQLGGMGIAVTRPATGLSIGGELEYADELTLSRAMANRHEIN